MKEIRHFIKSEYNVDNIDTLSWTERWRLFQRITWDLKGMDLEPDVLSQAEKDVADFLEL